MGTLIYDVTLFLVLDIFLTKIHANCVAHMLLPLSGLLAGVIPREKLLALVIPYSGNPKVRYYTVFSFGPFNINKSPFRCPYVLNHFGVAGRGNASH